MNLKDTFYLKRAGRYTNGGNSNDCLPIVYGDLTDGAAGIWKLPCVDTVNCVYCYAAHSVLSVADGNSICIYADGVLVDPANYTFDESDAYEGGISIATITFTTSQNNAEITAKGKGKSAAGELIENVIDIIDDFLTVENTFTSDLYEATHKARASHVFIQQGYKAAGVIQKDIQIWELLGMMMGAFLGSAYLDGGGKLVLEIETGVLYS